MSVQCRLERSSDRVRASGAAAPAGPVAGRSRGRRLGRLRLRSGAGHRPGLGQQTHAYGAHASAHRREIGAVMPEQRNLILAIVLSVTIIIAFQYFYELPRIKEAQRQQPQQTEQMTETAPQQAAPGVVPPAPRGVPASPEVARTQALATTGRV